MNVPGFRIKKIEFLIFNFEAFLVKFTGVTVYKNIRSILSLHLNFDKKKHFSFH